MLSKWLFSLLVLSTTAATSLANPHLGFDTDKSDVPAVKHTINLLKGLPKYDKANDPDGFLKLTHTAIDNLLRLENKKGDSKRSRNLSGCDLTKVRVRRDWAALSNAQKKRYTDAVNCLLSKPSKSDPIEIPGARNRLDDFVGVHIQQTFSIHATANFLTWHRYYTWLYEKALREECGYDGYQPYWNWGATAKKPYPSVLFNDGEFGISGDGEYIPHNLEGTIISTGGPDRIVIPFAPNGGGCVRTGPFANMTVNLGPILPTLDLVAPLPADQPLIYNPRCLRRSISQYVSSRWTTTADTLSLITQNPSIAAFQSRLDGSLPAGYAGLHTGGHFTIGGDPGGDFFSASGDPAFYLHHAQIDRVWYLWQLLDPTGGRFEQVSGTITAGNVPPSRNGTLEDWIEMGVLGERKRLRELVGTVDGPFCYIYL